MKKLKLKSSVFAGLAALALLFPNLKTGSLTDITKPYLGMYECQNATLGEDDIIDDFSYVRLELHPDETFTLYYRKKKGKEHKETGKYFYDKEAETICLSTGVGDVLKRTFPLKNGVISITMRMGTKTLQMQLKQK